MAFKISKSVSTSSESPESLFRDLRAKKIQGLLSHQADVLRDYVESSLDFSDVAFQLPTGSGKTLVGLLLGEWRRRKNNERIVYLCPTIQLVNQVTDQANNKYGIKAISFIGKKSEYDPKDKSEYQNAEVIAITTYSALFNSSPFFTDPNIIILDDAHAAENYIASNWSLRIERFNENHKNLFVALAGFLRPYISSLDYQKLTAREEDYWDKSWVDKLPTPVFNMNIEEITAIINTNISSADLAFQWSMIKNNLFACHFYFSAYEMLIRPLLPPTSTHTPFTIAKQRIYMSATLGEGGDLERITGRKNIHRLQIPTGWDKQGIGRRFFLLPERSLSDEEQDELLLKVITQTGRALILCPNDKSSITISKNINEKLGVPIFNARVIESSKIPFISEEMAVAVMANRYDGIDFPDDECRLLIIDGLPRATNLQERFIINNMGAVELLNDRILTRIVQAFGRCTRSATDYSVVIIRGEELTKYIMTRERRRFLHPEIQAEIDFGIEQSKSTSIDEFLENISIFIKQSSDWAEADSEILILRDKSEQLLLPGTDNLRNSANLENDYQNALWSGDIVTAFEISRSIISLLTAPELKGYRALWYYLAGSAAWLADFQKMGNFDSKSKELFRLALSATGTIRWLVELSRNNLVETPNSEMVDETQTLLLVERVEGILDKLGTIQNHKFDRFVSEIIAGLNSENFKEFEETHVKIGKLLGYEAGNKETNGAPDPWWIVDENFCFIFEDHSDAVSDTLHIDKARQINTHPNWVKENLDVSEHVKILPVLITPTKKADVDALPHLRDVFLWPLDDFRAWALNAISTIRELRSTFTGIGDLAWRADAVAAFNKNMLSPRTLSDYLQKHIAADELKEK